MNETQKRTVDSIFDEPVENKTNEQEIEVGVDTMQDCVAQGKMPIVISGNGNTITIVERQYNDSSAVRTLDAINEEGRRKGKLHTDFMSTVVNQIPVITDMIAKAAVKRSQEKTNTGKPSAPKKKAGKKK